MSKLIHLYWAYGLRIASEIACPELPSSRFDPALADVSVHLLPPLTEIQNPSEARCFQVFQDRFRLAVTDVAQYSVEAGRRILIEPLAGVAEDRIRLFLLGSTMGALLYQRGLFPLHGSAIETPWGAMLFVGAQGEGKSTLGAEFFGQGYRLLSDDVCAITKRKRHLEVLPALAQIRLCEDAYQRIGSPAEASFNVDKFVVPLATGYCRDPVPLRAIHVLGSWKQNEPVYKPIQGLGRIQALLENLYRPHYLMGQQTQGQHMQLAAEIAQRAEIATVHRRRNPKTIGDLVPFLERIWAERFDTITSAGVEHEPLPAQR